MNNQFELLKRGFAGEMNPAARIRVERLKRLRQMLLDNEPAFLAALTADYGYRSQHQSAFADITTTVKSASHAIRNLKFWMQRERRSVDMSLRLTGASCAVEYMPKGVVGILSPWNFPINLALSPLVSVLAAGNRAFIKPSESTPATAEVLRDCISEAFDPSEVAVICGGAEVARAFCELPFDHLIYTGGTQIAKSIMAAAATNLVPLTLELGGKSPVVIDDSANLELAARRVVFGKCFNAGQICIAPDYALMPAAKIDAFLALLKSEFENAHSSSHADDHVDIINERHQQRIDAYASSATEAGAAVHEFRSKSGKASLSVVVSNGAAGLIESEEIFGPALMIKAVESVDHAIEVINHRPPPLVIYYFGTAHCAFDALRNNTRSGAVVKNDVIFQYANDDLPFGGVGESGMGRYRGIDGFKEFSNSRAIFKSGLVDVSALVTPPYPKFFSTFNQLMRKL